MTNLENLKKLAEGLGADASKCSTNLGALNVISKALGGAGDAETNSQAIEDIAQAAPAAMEQNVEWGAGVIPQASAVNSVVIPDGVTSIGEHAFEEWDSLEAVTFPDSVKTIGTGAFYGAESIATVNGGNRVERIEGGAFGGCTALANMVFPETLEYIGAGAFSNSGLAEATIPGRVKSVYTGTFAAMKNLESITFSEGVEIVEAQSCAGCGALKIVNIPSSVTTIGTDQGGAFAGCMAVTEININKPEGSISGAPWGASNATVNWLG